MKRVAVLVLALGALGCEPKDSVSAPVVAAPSGAPTVPPAEPQTPEASEPPPAIPVADPPPPINVQAIDPGTLEANPKQLITAPAKYEHVFIRAALPVGTRYANLRYEGNNKNFRSKLSDEGLYRSGEASSADWREYMAGVKQMVVLRDSLFSQQDHPYLQRPLALMMPPAWVSVAVSVVQSGGTLRPMFTAPVDDDKAWTVLADKQALFGDFPGSDSLFTHATRSTAGATAADQTMTRNARTSLGALAIMVQAMVDAAPHGAEQVAKIGAAHIAASDRAYFGAQLRARVLIPIFVENPNEHESRDEGKGMGVWGRELAQEAIDLARHEVYARRLLDGDVGIERYDLRESSEQQRAQKVLQELVPAGSQGHVVWLWVNGGSDGHGNGNPATPYIKDFRAKLEAAPIEMSRVRLLSKPSVRPWGDKAKATLATATKLYRDLGIPLSLQISTRNFRKLIGG